MSEKRDDGEGRDPLGGAKGLRPGDTAPEVQEDDPLAFLHTDEPPAPSEGDPLIPLDLAPEVPPVPDPVWPAEPEVPPTPDPIWPAAPARPGAVPAIIMDTPEPGPPGGTARERAEYTNEPPSIVLDRPREPAAVPPGPPRAAAPRPRAAAAPKPVLPRWAPVAAAVVALVAGSLVLYRMLAAPPPVISAVSPPKIEPGANLTVTGEGLSGASALRVGSAEGQVVSRSDTQVVATVPEDAPTGASIQVAVESGRHTSNALMVHVVRFPRLRAVVPDVAQPGQEVVLQGGALQGKSTAVHIGRVPAVILGGGETTLRVRVPALDVPEGGSVDVLVQVDGERARPMTLLIGRLPLVSGLDPAAGTPGTRVTVHGRGFDAQADGNAVAFGGEQAVVLSATPTALVVAAPAAAGLASGAPVPVSVTAGGARSGQAVFTLRRDSSEGYRPRFFPARVDGASAEREVAVASEIGPVLLLGGRGDAPSTAERAMRVAEALTRMVDAGAPVAFEARDAVVTAGGAPLLTATAGDADTYARAAGGRGARAAPRQLAAFWAALLQDYVGLFAARARPVRTADLTDRARVLLDLFAETERQGRSLVPVRLVAEMGPGQRKALRDLALVLPGGANTSGVAVAGRWDGQMEEGGLSRAFQVEITSEGGRLGGSLTTRAGNLDMRVPLRGVAYAAGTVTFTATVGGTARTFRGRLEGVQVTGTIHPESRPETAGRFTLRLVG